MRYFHPAQPNELQCDLDSDEAFTTFRNGVRMIRESRHLHIVKVIVRESSTKGHRHGVVVLKENLGIMERIALQLTLGDDPVRGLMNWGRAKNNDPNPIILIDNRPSFKDPALKARFKCDCKNTDRLPRCKHLRAIQTSRAEFMPRNFINRRKACFAKYGNGSTGKPMSKAGATVTMLPAKTRQKAR